MHLFYNKSVPKVCKTLFRGVAKKILASYNLLCCGKNNKKNCAKIILMRNFKEVWNK